MLIDAREAHRTDGPHQPYSLRLALHDALRGTLYGPGAVLHIERAIGSDGEPIPSRNLQIALTQVTPEGWLLTSKRDGDHGLRVWRLT